MRSEERERCLICIRVVASGLGRYPFTCANGHTLYRGSGATFDAHGLKVPLWCYDDVAQHQPAVAGGEATNVGK